MGELIHLDGLDSPDLDAPRCPSCGTVVAEPAELCAGVCRGHILDTLGEISA